LGAVGTILESLKRESFGPNIRVFYHWPVDTKKILWKIKNCLIFFSNILGNQYATTLPILMNILNLDSFHLLGKMKIYFFFLLAMQE